MKYLKKEIIMFVFLLYLFSFEDGQEKLSSGLFRTMQEQNKKEIISEFY